MHTPNHRTNLGTLKLIIPTTLVVMLIAIVSCKDQTQDTGTDSTPTTNATESSTGAATTTPATPGQQRATATQLDGYLYDLIMTKDQYVTLRKSKPGGGSSTAIKMVFQFYFDNAVPNGPTLIAYAAKKFTRGNRYGPNADPSTGRVSEVLAISNVPRLNLSDAAGVNGKFTLGDQEISFAEIESQYLLDLTPEGPTFTLIFRPEQSGRNIRYRICLEGAACPNPAPETQPSPPANTE